MPAKMRKSGGTPNTEQIALMGISYIQNKNAIKEYESECKKIRGPLEDYVASAGITLESGSRLAVVPYADKDVHLKQTLRVGKTLLPEAIDVLKENHLDDCVEMIPIVREDVLERMISEGKVSDDVLKRVYVTKPSYAFSVELKNRISDAPEE